MRRVRISTSFEVDTELSDEDLDYYLSYLLGDFSELIPDNQAVRKSNFLNKYETIERNSICTQVETKQNK